MLLDRAKASCPKRKKSREISTSLSWDLARLQANKRSDRGQTEEVAIAGQVIYVWTTLGHPAVSPLYPATAFSSHPRREARQTQNVVGTSSPEHPPN